MRRESLTVHRFRRVHFLPRAVCAWHSVRLSIERKLISAPTKQRFAFSSGVNSLASSSNIFICLRSRCFLVKQNWMKREKGKRKVENSPHKKWIIVGEKVPLMLCFRRRGLTYQTLSEIVCDIKQFHASHESLFKNFRLK